jgi:hypothetical protein
VIPGVLSAAECDAEVDRMWDWVERVSPGVGRKRPQTWDRDAAQKAWPHKQKDMMQGYQAGWVFTGLRAKLAERVFEPLYGTRELHTSKDGFTLMRPQRRPAARALGGHFDQGRDVSSTGLEPPHIACC